MTGNARFTQVRVSLRLHRRHTLVSLLALSSPSSTASRAHVRTGALRPPRRGPRQHHILSRRLWHGRLFKGKLFSLKNHLSTDSPSPISLFPLARRAQQVCKRFYKVMHSSVLLKYLRARSLAGFVDVAPRTFPVIERYRRLRAHENNWRRLRWKKKSTLKLEASLGAYEMNGGVFGYSSRGNESIVFTVLSSVPEKQNMIQWHHPVDKLDMMDFTFNCDLNLLCLIVRDYERYARFDAYIVYLQPLTPFFSLDSPFAIHLRTMTGNSAHPEAENSILRCSPICKPYWPERQDLEAALIEFTVQVYYDWVACLYQLSPYGGKDMVIVWNWRSGEIVKVDFAFAIVYHFLVIYHIFL